MSEMCCYCGRRPRDENKATCAECIKTWVNALPAMAPPNQTHGLAGPVSAAHIRLDRSEESEVLCGEYSTYMHGDTGNPREASCIACLRIAAEFGKSAVDRLAHITVTHDNRVWLSPTEWVEP